MKKIILAACLFTSTVVNSEQIQSESLHTGKKSFILTLVNGEELSVYLPNNEAIHLSDGSHEWVIASENIQKLFNDGWLFGEYVTSEGTSEKFSYAFTKDRNLVVYLAKENRSMELPWHKISSLCQLDIAFEPNIAYEEYNGRDYDDFLAEKIEEYHSISDSEKEREVFIGAVENPESASLGFEILLDPEDFFVDKAPQRKKETKPVLAGLEFGDIPNEITFTPNIPAQKTSEIALAPVKEELPEIHPNEDLIEEEDDEEEDIIFVSQDLSLDDYESLSYASDAIPFEIFDNTWDDISADFFVYGLDEVDLSLYNNLEESYHLPMIPSHHLL